MEDTDMTPSETNNPTENQQEQQCPEQPKDMFQPPSQSQEEAKEDSHLALREAKDTMDIDGQEGQDQNSYRFVTKEYYCYICQKKAKKMVQMGHFLDHGLTCDTCHQGFCEIIDLDSDFKGMIQAGMI